MFNNVKSPAVIPPVGRGFPGHAHLVAMLCSVP